MTRQTEIEKAIKAEVEEFWPGVEVEFVMGGKHPKAKFAFKGQMLSRAYPGTPSDSANGIAITLGTMRRILRQLGAERAKPDPTPDEDRKRHKKPNDGRERRPPPVASVPATARPDMADQLADHPAAPDPLEELLEGNRAAAAAKPAAPARFAEMFGEGGEVEVETLDEGEAEARRAALLGLVGSVVDGIYFGLPAEVYHAVPRLSASGIQRLLVSPANFWKGSWLDPNRPELDEDETKAQILGKAYHCARLEPEVFEARFCRELDKADYPKRGTVWNGTEIGAALADLGETKKRAEEGVAEQAQRLEDAGFEGAIWPLEQARWKGRLAGRTPIPAKFWDEITTDMERLRGSQEIAELLSGGEAEVSIFWTDRYGIKMKSRVDYLRLDLWDDFKTFDNTRGKALASALADAVRYNRYHVQAVTYREAVEAIRVGGLQIVGDATDAQRKLVAAIQMRPDELACWYIFQEKNGVPNLLARRFPFFAVNALTETELQIFIDDESRRDELREKMAQKTGLHIRAMGDIDRAKREFMLYSQVYEAGRPWAPINPRAAFDDFDFNQAWLEGRYE